MRKWPGGRGKVFFPKLRGLSELKRKIKGGKAVSIGVFCSGNGDRSPLIEQVLRAEFGKKGLSNVHVFSFGLSTAPQRHMQGAAQRTADYAKELGYAGIAGHKRRHIGDEDVQREITNADLLFAVSPSHMAFLAEYGADENPEAAPQMLRKTWTLKGFAGKKQWALPFDGLARAFNRLYRGIATKDPYFQPKTPEGNRAFKRMLDDAIADAKKAAKRLVA